MKKFTLEPEYDFDFFMIGISCHLKDYRIAWFMNNQLDINLVKTADHKVFIRKADEFASEFSLFSFEDEENHSQFLLLANHCETGDLLVEQKHFDYFLIIKGSLYDEQVEEIITTIKSINQVQLVSEMFPSTLKSKNNLIIDI